MGSNKAVVAWLACAAIITLTSGCSTGDNPSTRSSDMKTKCLDGVTYYLFKESAGYSGWGFMAPKYNVDGSLSLCSNTEL